MERTVISFDSDLEIIVPTEFLKSRPSDRKASTSQIAYLSNRRYLHKDLRYKLSCLKNLISLSTHKELIPINPISGDVLAGCGFTSQIIKKYLSPNKFFLNDFDEDCYQILIENFSFNNSIFISNQDASDILKDKKYDFLFLDFNTFSLIQAAGWNSIWKLGMSNSTTTVFTDTASFGFRFGDRFLSSYKINTYYDYYKLLNTTIEQEFNKKIVKIKIYPNHNAALVLCTNKPIAEFSEDCIQVESEMVNLDVLTKTGSLFD